VSETTEQDLPEQIEGELVNIKDRGQRRSLVVDIARRADTLKEAIAVAKEHGSTHRQAWYIWTKELRNEH
jgi:RecG-like helicase